MSQGDLSDQLSYHEALAELETILDAIEHDEVDLDELAQKVERAASLLSWCRDKIDRAELQVRRVVEALDAPPRP